MFIQLTMPDEITFILMLKTIPYITKKRNYFPREFLKLFEKINKHL